MWKTHWRQAGPEIFITKSNHSQLRRPCVDVHLFKGKQRGLTLQFYTKIVFNKNAQEERRKLKPSK